MDNSGRHKSLMGEAIKEAETAFKNGDIPIGAVIVKNDEIIGRGYNKTEYAKDPTQHAEINAIREAASSLNSWRLNGCTMYVTTEPCTMCAGALVASRIDKVYIGTESPKGGACGTLKNLLEDERLNHRVDSEFGILRDECERLLKDFFKEIRKR